MPQTAVEPKVHTFELEARPCESCGGRELENIWLNRFTAKTRTAAWQFDLQNVICRSCGFIFVSPNPASQELSDYYKDSFSYVPQQDLDYDVENRLRFIRRHIQPDFSRYLEIGANIQTEFHQQLKTMFTSVSAMEPNQSVDSQHRSLETVPDHSVDMVASYFVLEHIPGIREFLENCRRILKPGGMMIIEVPDMDLYESDMSAMIFHEHVNHFTFTALQRAAAAFGFELLEGSRELCSRNFGFAAAFRLKQESLLFADLPNEYDRNKAIFMKGLERVEAYFEQFRMLRERITEMMRQGQKVTLWAANVNTVYFMNGYTLPESVKIVDSNPDKKDFLTDTPVYQPCHVTGHIMESELLVIFCGAVHKSAIISSIRENYGKTFRDDQIILTDFW